MVGDVTYSIVTYFHWGLPSAHIIPLILPHCFYLMRFTAWSALYCYCRYTSSGSCGPKTLRLCNCLYLLSIYTTDILPYVLIPCLSPIWVKHLFTVVLYNSSSYCSSFGYSNLKQIIPVLVLYIFSSMIGSR